RLSRCPARFYSCLAHPLWVKHQPAFWFPTPSVPKIVLCDLIPLRPEVTGTSPFGETPSSIRAVYKLPSTGGGGVIAIVDAFHYPTAENDLRVFSSQFKLPACTKANGCFRQVFANGTQPQTNCGRSQSSECKISTRRGWEQQLF